MRYKLVVIPIQEDGEPDYPEQIEIGEGVVPDELIPMWLEKGREAVERSAKPDHWTK